MAMRRLPSSMLGDKADATYLGGTRFKFTYRKCGHTETKDYSKGPVARRMSEGGCKLMASWWSRGGVLAVCRKCERQLSR